MWKYIEEKTGGKMRKSKKNGKKWKGKKIHTREKLREKNRKYLWIRKKRGKKEKIRTHKKYISTGELGYKKNW